MAVMHIYVLNFHWAMNASIHEHDPGLGGKRRNQAKKTCCESFLFFIPFLWIGPVMPLCLVSPLSFLCCVQEDLAEPAAADMGIRNILDVKPELG